MFGEQKYEFDHYLTMIELFWPKIAIFDQNYRLELQIFELKIKFQARKHIFRAFLKHFCRY